MVYYHSRQHRGRNRGPSELCEASPVPGVLLHDRHHGYILSIVHPGRACEIYVLHQCLGARHLSRRRSSRVYVVPEYASQDIIMGQTRQRTQRSIDRTGDNVSHRSRVVCRVAMVSVRLENTASKSSSWKTSMSSSYG